jgi:hypothetical protein
LHVVQRSGEQSGVAETAQARSEEILLVGAANFDNFRRHSDEECRTF